MSNEILTINKLIQNLVDEFGEGITVKIYFLRDKAIIKKMIEWDDRIVREAYINPLRILVSDNESTQSIPCDDLKIKFKMAYRKSFNFFHAVNIIEAVGKQEEANGIKYYPWKIVVRKREKQFMDGLYEKYKDMPQFSFYSTTKAKEVDSDVNEEEEEEEEQQEKTAEPSDKQPEEEQPEPKPKRKPRAKKPKVSIPDDENLKFL